MNEELNKILNELKSSLSENFGGGDDEKAKAGFKVYELIEEVENE